MLRSSFYHRHVRDFPVFNLYTLTHSCQPADSKRAVLGRA